MICYTKMESLDHGLLVFKVIGVQSQMEAQKITMENWEKILMDGQILEGPPTICPLFSDLTQMPYK